MPAHPSFESLFTPVRNGANPHFEGVSESLLGGTIEGVTLDLARG